MAIDVVIDPANGQIYWNDNQTTAQSIAISGNATDKINFIGYSGAFGGTAGSAPNDPVTRVTINDSASDTLIPGSNGFELGNSANRWAVSATTLNATGAITLSYSPATGVNTNHTLRITSAPLAEASGAVIEMGATTAFDNSTANFFNGSANGTYLAIRSASTFTGDYLNFGKQDGISTTFSVSSNGNVTVKTSNQYGFVVNDTNNGNKFVVDTNNTRVGIGKPADYPLDVRHTTGNTNTVNTILALESRSSATTEAEFGSGAIFRIQNSSGTVVSSSGIDGILSVVGASYRGSIVFKTNGSGSDVLSEKVRISYNNILLSPYDAGNGTYELRFNAQTGANYVGFKAPSSINTSVMWTLPSSVGSTGQFLKVGASGVLSWDTITAGTGTVTSIAAGTGLTGGTITATGTIAIDTGVVPTLTATTNAFSSGATTGSTTSSAFSLVANSVTTGTGAYFASNSVTSGRLVDIALSGNTGSGTRYGLSIAVSGANTAGTISYGVFSNVTATVSATNIAAGLFASGGTNNVPLRLGLSASFYTNFFINNAGNGITLSPTGNGTPFLSLAGYDGVVQEFRLCSAGGGVGNNYVGFKSPLSLAESVIWTLPNVDGTNGQVLATNGSGTLSWATASGSVSVGGTNNGDIQYKSSSSLGGSANLNYDATNNELKVLNYAPATNSASTAALKILTGTSWTGSGNGTLIAGNAVSGFTGNLIDLQVNAGSKFKVSATGAVRIADNYTLPTSAPVTTGQVLTYDGTNVIWGTGGSAPVGSLTVNPGVAGKITYYPSAGDVVDDASALDYATTGTNLTITASAIGVIPLAVTGIAGQTASIFKAILNTTDAFVINNAGNISTGTWNASTIGASYGGTGQTTYTDGQLLIGNSSNTLTKATLTAGSGIAVTNGSGSISVRQKRPLYLTFCAGFTPSASGVDSAVLRIPDSATDGTTALTYNVREFFIRVETASAGTSSVQLEYYTGTGAFSATGNMMTSALSISGASTYESSTTTFSQTTLTSGNKVRLNFTALDGTHTNFFIQLLLEEN